MAMVALMKLFNAQTLDEFNIHRIWAEAIDIMVAEEEFYANAAEHGWGAPGRNMSWQDMEDELLLLGVYSLHRTLPAAIKRLHRIKGEYFLTDEDVKGILVKLKEFQIEGEYCE